MGKILIIKGANFEENALELGGVNLLEGATFVRKTVGASSSKLELEDSITRISTIIEIPNVERISCKIQSGYKYFLQYSNSNDISLIPYSSNAWNDTDKIIDVPSNTVKLWVAIAHTDNSEIQLSESDTCIIYDVTDE